MSDLREFKQILSRIVRDRITPAAQSRSAWDVCEEIVLTLPERFAQRLAAEFLVDAYFKAVDHVEPEPQPVPRSGKRHLSAVPLGDGGASERMWASIDSAMAGLKAAFRADWTAELLSQTFALPDGTAVAWGDASAEHHRAATSGHRQSAEDHIAAAVRHDAALDLLAETGAVSLNAALTDTARTAV